MLETNAIITKISAGDSVLEIGCGACDNSLGYMKKATKYIGVEKIETFVELSREKIKENNISNSSILMDDGYEYVKDTEFRADKLLTQRFLINLRNRELQLDFFKWVKKNSLNRNLKLIVCEGFYEEMHNLNMLRKLIGLNAIQVSDYNNFLDSNFISDVVDVGYEVEDCIIFNDYYFITRIFNTDLFESNVDIQKLGYEIENSNLMKIKGDISYTKIYFMRFSK
tara:strand:+ start:15 stop:689 length:675 start_codon:yes stop_codon:yes gene_type:complete